MEESLTISTVMPAERKRNITQVINDYSKRLFGFIRKRVNNEADAQDIMQDVFFQFVGNTQPIDQLTAWLFKVARNKITDKQRKHKPTNFSDLYTEDEQEDIDGFSDLLLDTGDDPEKEYLRTLFWQELNTALQELPEEQREIFIKHELEGISFKDLSEASGEPVNTLISRKRYAVLHLRERLRELKEELINY